MSNNKDPTDYVIGDDILGQSLRRELPDLHRRRRRVFLGVTIAPQCAVQQRIAVRLTDSTAVSIL